MPTKSWKSWELRLARLLGGERRGAHYGDAGGGYSDVRGLGWAKVEAKLRKRYGWADVEAALDQVEAAQDETAETDALPFAVLKVNGRGRLDLDAVVVIRLRWFLRFLVRVGLVASERPCASVDDEAGS